MEKIQHLSYTLKQRLWLSDLGGDARVTGVSVKVSPSGLLMVIKAVSAEGPKVAFVGASDFGDLLQKGNDLCNGGQLRWKEDRFALDKNHQVG